MGRYTNFRLALVAALLVTCIASRGQEKKYQSLFWEISGNGLKKPCYLYGSMHVSNKIAFHLPDSFFMALKACDMVALEENPERFIEIYDFYNYLRSQNNRYSSYYYSESSKRDYGFYGSAFRTPLLTRNRLIDLLPVDNSYINQLLYRYESTYRGNESGDYSDNFAEQTYLDLFVYQAARKTGKAVINLENYLTTIDLELKSMVPDEPGSRDYDYQYESGYDISSRIDDAYIRGDLDLLDSILRKSNPSKNYQKYFIGERNRVMALGMDSLMQRGIALFTTVGCAHLPGNTGIIELLREKGYTLRPVKKYLISKKTRAMKELEEKKVKVNFKPWCPADSTFDLQVPGTPYLFPTESHNRYYLCPDMANGSYYFIARIPTFQFLYGNNVSYVLQQTDSALYQGIPGEILSRKEITRNGYRGFDILNQTKRGDLQRYQIFITPLEVLIFKMGGTGEYVKTESDPFFNSIRFRTPSHKINLKNDRGGFSISTGNHYTLNQNEIDGYKKAVTNLVLQSYDSLGYCLMMRATYHDYEYIEEDNFELAMIAGSFVERFENYKVTDSTFTTDCGYPCLIMNCKSPDNRRLSLKVLISGPTYYLIATAGNRENALSQFGESLKVNLAECSDFIPYHDTINRFTLEIPAVEKPRYPDVTNMLDKMGNQVTQKTKDYESDEYSRVFRYRASGEEVGLNVYRYQRYAEYKSPEELWSRIRLRYYDRDALNELYDKFGRPDNWAVIFAKILTPEFGISREKFSTMNGHPTYLHLVTDSGSRRGFLVKMILHGRTLYTLKTCIDTVSGPGPFAARIFETFNPSDTAELPGLCDTKRERYYSNLSSADTNLVREALESAKYRRFRAGEVSDISRVLREFNFRKWGNEYLEEFIFALGETKSDSALPVFRDLYIRAGDTSAIKFSVLENLADMQTRSSYNLIRELLAADIPMPGSTDGADGLFVNLSDSLELSSSLFPDLLHLTRFEEYRNHVYGLLAEIRDSGLINPGVYKTGLRDILADGRNELRRTISKENDFADEYEYSYDYGDESYELYNYCSILIPFYDDPQVKTLIDKCLNINDEDLKLNIALLMLKNGRSIPDTLLLHYAKADKYRWNLYEKLSQASLLKFFPPEWKSQELIARSLLFGNRSKSSEDTVVFIGSYWVSSAKGSGNVYFFKYRGKKKTEWKLAYQGPHPADTGQINLNEVRVEVLSTEKLTRDESKNHETINRLLRSIALSGRQRTGYDVFRKKYYY